ncbi:MAG: DUF433 domain-containing protein [Acidobacteriota bacterium]
MHSEYIEERNGGYYVVGSRVSLDSIVYAFNEGLSPDAVQENFPLLHRAQVYGAIAFYLDHQAAIDEYLTREKQEFEAASIPMERANPSLWEKVQLAQVKSNEPLA